MPFKAPKALRQSDLRSSHRVIIVPFVAPLICKKVASRRQWLRASGSFINFNSASTQWSFMLAQKASTWKWMCKCFNYKFSLESIFVECIPATVMLVIEFKMLMWKFKFQSGSDFIFGVNIWLGAQTSFNHFLERCRMARVSNWHRNALLS